MRKIKVLVEERSDGFVACPVGLKGVVVGQGDSCDDALADFTSASCFHTETFGETFGREAMDGSDSIRDVFLVDAEVPV